MTAMRLPDARATTLRGTTSVMKLAMTLAPSVVRLPVDKPALASTTTQYRAKNLCASELGPLRI